MCKLNLQLQCAPATYSQHAVQEQYGGVDDLLRIGMPAQHSMYSLLCRLTAYNF
ncbi:MAG TPA: hypothetical protein VFS25_02870 [Chitinophaga sp.]|uniref:hypothetical protein n=1 Tax=Chitinophaga sp. TaxID=1869181 RepID=UPI002DB6DE25|nr:hypothetical protein [Chitinophaga sp.]HEU4551742.1 hypothetical protein [Chitinophaga sp.]